MEPLEIVLFAVGTFLLLLGWLLYRVALWLSGALLAGALGALLGLMLAQPLGNSPPELEWIWAAGGGVIGAALGIVAAQYAHRFLFFVGGFIATLAASWWIVEWARTLDLEQLAWLDSDLWAAVSMTATALAGGLLVSWFDWLVIAALASAVGAAMVTQALSLAPPLTLAIAAGGIVIQTSLHLLTKRRRDEE